MALQERVLEVLALMISSPPRREEELVLIEQAGAMPGHDIRSELADAH